jgi:hypothetical protein
MMRAARARDDFQSACLLQRSPGHSCGRAKDKSIRLFIETADGGVRWIRAHDDLSFAVEKLDRRFFDRFGNQNGIQGMDLWSKGDLLTCA